MNKKYRICSILLALVMFIVLFSGCGQQTTTTPSETTPTTEVTSTAEDSWLIDTSPVVLSIYANIKQGADTDYNTFWGKNYITKKITEETGVTPVFSFNPDDSDQRLNLMIAANQLPDIIYSASARQLREMIDGKLIWDLSELSKTAAPNFMSKVPPNILLNMRMAYNTMGFYMVPTSYARPEVIEATNLPKSAWGPTIIADIYKELGSPPVKTGDDYINLMKQALAKHPDLILHSSRESYLDKWNAPGMLLNILLPMAGITEFEEKDGKIITFLDDPDFVKVIQFANRLYKENVLYKDEFTDNSDAKMANLLSAKLIGELSEAWDNLSYFAEETLKKNTPYTNYMMLDLFQIIPGRDPIVKANTYTGGNTKGFMISANSAKADRALRFIEYMVYNEETQRDIIYGEPGVTYDLVDGKPVIRKDIFEQWNKDTINVTNTTGICFLAQFRNEEWQPEMYKQLYGNPDYVVDALNKVNKYAVDLTKFDNLDNYPADSEEVKISASIKEYYATKITEIITGPAQNVESSVKTLVDQIHKMGLEKLNAFLTAGYNGYIEKLNKYKP